MNCIHLLSLTFFKKESRQPRPHVAYEVRNLRSQIHLHADHTISYPETGTFESAGPCPATHPVRTSQVMFEVLWDTKQFNNLEWPTDGSNPFVWSFGDATGYANHADYIFGWKGDALQRALDAHCTGNQCSALTTQSTEQALACQKQQTVPEETEGCKLRERRLRRNTQSGQVLMDRRA